MSLWAMDWKRAVRHLAVALFVGSVGAFGCGKSEPPKADKPADADPRAAAASGEGKEEATKKDVPAKPDPAPDDPLHQPFARAVRLHPPIDCQVPPSVTASGKSVYKIFSSVKDQWEGIRFTTADGKPIHYSATVQTELGEIDIQLRPDLAPNHVRSFVALARAGYYDQLYFDRVNHEEYPDNPGRCLDFLEAGCPTGRGEDGYGSVGYWLYPETHPSTVVKHEVGTVGACRWTEPDSAACKFYILLCEAPEQDTNQTIFGKVTRGLDVARKIHRQPIAEDDRGHYGCLHPERPVMIRKIVIHSDEPTATEGKK